MNQLIESLERALNCRNWYAALFIALSLPDICVSATQPRTSRKGYAEWFDAYVQPKYSIQPPTRMPTRFLSGNDCYAFRCAFLHEGMGNITGQSARESLNSFIFVAPMPNGLCLHNNMKIMLSADGSEMRILQLQVDLFSKEIIAGVEDWREGLTEQQLDKFERGLLRIQQLGNDPFRLSF